MTVGALEQSPARPHQSKMQNSILLTEMRKLEKIVPGLQDDQENVNMVGIDITVITSTFHFS